MRSWEILLYDLFRVNGFCFLVNGLCSVDFRLREPAAVYIHRELMIAHDYCMLYEKIKKSL